MTHDNTHTPGTMVAVQPNASHALAVLPASAKEPAMTNRLAYVVENFFSRGDAALTSLTVVERTEAQTLMRYFDRATGPAKPDAVLIWLTKVAIAVARPPTAAEIEMKLVSVMETSGDLCTAAWTAETRLEFSRSCGWWPSDAEIDKFLRPISYKFKSKRRALMEVIKAVPAQEEARKAPTDAEKDAVAASMALMAADLEDRTAKLASKISAPLGPVHASNSSMIDTYRRAAALPGPGQAVAQARLKSLLAKVEGASA